MESEGPQPWKLLIRECVVIGQAQSWSGEDVACGLWSGQSGFIPAASTSQLCDSGKAVIPLCPKHPSLCQLCVPPAGVLGGPQGQFRGPPHLLQGCCSGSGFPHTSAVSLFCSAWPGQISLLPPSSSGARTIESQSSEVGGEASPEGLSH